VLRHRDIGARHDERGDRRDIGRPEAVAAGAAGVHENRLLDKEGSRMLPHRARGPDHLRERLPLFPQIQQELLHLIGRKLRLDDAGDRLAGFLLREIGAPLKFF